MQKNTWYKTPREDKRVYHYPNAAPVSFEGVSALRVTESGVHYLEKDDRPLAIVAPGWTHIIIEADDWAVL